MIPSGAISMKIKPENAAHIAVTEVLGQQLLVPGRLAPHPERIIS